MNTQVCRKCKEEKRLPEDFYRDRKEPTGYSKLCKLCRRAEQKSYRDILNGRLKKSYKTPPDKLKGHPCRKAIELGHRFGNKGTKTVSGTIEYCCFVCGAVVWIYKDGTKEGNALIETCEEVSKLGYKPSVIDAETLKALHYAHGLGNDDNSTWPPRSDAGGMNIGNYE